MLLEAGELLAVVECEGLDELVGDALERRFRCPIQGRGPLVVHLLGNEVAGLAFHESSDKPLMMAADDRIAFPIAYAAAFIHEDRPLLD